MLVKQILDVLPQFTKSLTALLQRLLMGNGREWRYQYHSHYLKKKSYKQTKVSRLLLIHKWDTRNPFLLFYIFTIQESCHSINMDHSSKGIKKETNLQQRGPRSMLCPQTQCWSDAETLQQTLAPGTSQSTPAMSPALENHY